MFRTDIHQSTDIFSGIHVSAADGNVLILMIQENLSPVQSSVTSGDRPQLQRPKHTGCPSWEHHSLPIHFLSMGE